MANKKRIDFDQLENLLQINCTKYEVAAFFGVSEDTIERRVKEHYEETFAVIKQRFASHANISIRRKQIEVAQAGNVKMLIWLGKNMLNQTDKMEHAGNSEKPVLNLNFSRGRDEKTHD